MSTGVIVVLIFFVSLVIFLILCEVITYFTLCERHIFNDKESLEDAINNNIFECSKHYKFIHFEDHNIDEIVKYNSILFKYYLIDCNLNYYGIYRWGESSKIIDKFFKSRPRETYINTRLFN